MKKNDDQHSPVFPIRSQTWSIPPPTQKQSTLSCTGSVQTSTTTHAACEIENSMNNLFPHPGTQQRKRPWVWVWLASSTGKIKLIVPECHSPRVAKVHTTKYTLGETKCEISYWNASIFFQRFRSQDGIRLNFITLTIAIHLWGVCASAL